MLPTPFGTTGHLGVRGARLPPAHFAVFAGQLVPGGLVDDIRGAHLLGLLVFLATFCRRSSCLGIGAFLPQVLSHQATSSARLTVRQPAAQTKSWVANISMVVIARDYCLSLRFFDADSARVSR